MLKQKTPELRTDTKPGFPEHKEFSSLSPSHKKMHTQTRVVVKSDVGFGNQLFIRGQGANLSWDRGLPLKNIKQDEWVWETDSSFNSCEFKILINDFTYESGENHLLDCGATIQYTPKFN